MENGLQVYHSLSMAAEAFGRTKNDGRHGSIGEFNSTERTSN